jgi:hypothetical protein
MKTFFFLILGITCFATIEARAAEPMLQGELEITGWSEWAAGTSYRVQGEFWDYSVVGKIGTDLETGHYLFTETILGDVDAWQITNIVAAGTINVTVDVCYAESGTSRVGMVVGYAPVCALSSNAAGFPQQPGPEFCHVSENMMNGIRNYAFRRIGTGGDWDGGTIKATNYVVLASAEQVLTNGATIEPYGNVSVTTTNTLITLATPQIRTNGVPEGMTMYLRGAAGSGGIQLTNGVGVRMDCGLHYLMNENDIMHFVFLGGMWQEMKRLDQ